MPARSLRSYARKGAWIGSGFGLLLLVAFGPLFGGAGGVLIGVVYTFLVFPLHLLGGLIVLIFNKPIGEMRFGLLLLLLSLPISYGVIGWIVGRMIAKWKRGQKYL